MTSAPTRTPGPWQALPAPTPGPQAQTLTLALSRGELACLVALASAWGWSTAHTAEHLLCEELRCRHLDSLGQADGEVSA